MKLRIWGACGSIPSPMTTKDLQERLREVLERSKGVNLDDPIAVARFIERLPPTLTTVVSGNTSCFEVRAGDALFILDMGSGLRMFSKRLMSEAFGHGQGEAHILISHTHYDHIEGFPFFVPAFVPGNQLHFHSPYEDMEDRMRQFMRHPFFPVDLDYPQATRIFHTLVPGQVHEIAGAEVELIELNHPGRAFAYRITCEGKSLVYATDAEYPNMHPDYTRHYEEFFRDADALIFDAMYTYEDAVTNKVDWGHSTAKVGAELAWRAGVKRLILSHHEPISTAQELWSKINDADHHLRYRASREGNEGRPPVEVILAQEGLTLDL
jgi:phosphoribosyl 1,2-cyclic phosphodiesterase